MTFEQPDGWEHWPIADRLDVLTRAFPSGQIELFEWLTFAREDMRAAADALRKADAL